MAHKVMFNLPERNLGKSDAEFKVWRDNQLAGTLRVSKGSLVWYPKGTSYGYKVGWRKFDKLMREQTRFEKR